MSCSVAKKLHKRVKSCFQLQSASSFGSVITPIAPAPVEDFSFQKSTKDVSENEIVTEGTLICVNGRCSFRRRPKPMSTRKHVLPSVSLIPVAPSPSSLCVHHRQTRIFTKSRSGSGYRIASEFLKSYKLWRLQFFSLAQL